MKYPMAAEAPSKRDQSSCALSRTGVTSTSSTAGLSDAAKSGCSDTPGAGGMSVTASVNSPRSRSRSAFTLERPALQQLLADIEDGLVDVVVVYKIDRLSRSLMDFSKLVEVFDRNGVTFVSVTQSFNTTTSMGRLTLNILLSFAQFEREVTAERIRDKVKASRMKGMWMGGYVPLGYDVVDRKLVVNQEEAAKVRMVFERFVEVGSATVLAKELRHDGFRNKQGTLIDKGYLYRLLNNRVYRGEAVHKGKSYPGEHEAIIAPRLWEQVHDIMSVSPRKRANNSRTQTQALLKGLLFTATGAAMTPSSTKKGTRRYRYYVSMDLLKNRETPEDGIPRRLPADTVEAAVITEIRRVLRTPETTAQVIAALDLSGYCTWMVTLTVSKQRDGAKQFRRVKVKTSSPRKPSEGS